MNIAEYIINDFKPLSLENTIDDALDLCKNYQITHIPIVNREQFLGCISQNDILNLESKQEVLQHFSDIILHFQSSSNESLLSIFSLFAENDANFIPIIKDYQYLGYIHLNDVLDAFSQTPFLSNEGFVLVIQKNNKDFTMSQVTQIVESNNGILLGCYISKKSEEKTELTLKISSEEINEIIQTFRRYNYTIITEHEDDIYLEELKNRADYLQKFLNT